MLGIMRLRRMLPLLCPAPAELEECINAEWRPVPAGVTISPPLLEEEEEEEEMEPMDPESIERQRERVLAAKAKFIATLTAMVEEARRNERMNKE